MTVSEFAMRLDFSGSRINSNGGNIGSGNQISVVHNHYNALTQNPIQQRYSEIARWLYSFTPDQKAIYNSILNVHVEGTGGSILTAPGFVKWERGERRYLECVGMPGAGKSMVASIVISHLERTHLNPDRPTTNDAMILYYFCRYDLTSLQSIDRVLCNLLGQIVEHKSQIPLSSQSNSHSELSPALASLYEEYRNHPTVSPSLKSVSKALSRELRSSLESATTPTFIVIDALDEFSTQNDGSDQLLIEHLENLNESVRIMVTSRTQVPFSGISRSLWEDPAASLGVSIRICASDEDIALYVRDRCLRGPWSNAIRSSKQLREEIVGAVRANAGGMFIIAQLQTDLLQGYRYPRAIRDALKKLPATLEDTYKETMRRIFEKGSGDKDLAICVFSWVLGVKTILPLESLRRAVATREGMTGAEIEEENLPSKLDLLAVCGGLVEENVIYSENILSEWMVMPTGPKLTTLRFAHNSTSEFLSTHSALYLGTIHHTILTTCMHYIIAERTLIPPFRLERGYALLRRRNFHPYRVYLLDYAVCFWGRHAKECDEEFDVDLVVRTLRDTPAIALLSQSLRFRGVLPTAGAGNPFPQQRQDSSSMAPGQWRLPSADAVFIYFDLVKTLSRIHSNSSVNTNIVEKRWPKSDGGISNIAWAAWVGSCDVANMLIERGGSDVMEEVVDDGGRAAIFYAVKRNQREMVRLLVEKGARLDVVDETGRSPMDYAEGNDDGQKDEMSERLAEYLARYRKFFKVA